MSEDWGLRARIFLQRFWQPTFACMACMPPGSLLAKAWSFGHWTNALQTGLLTGILALLLSFTPAKALFGNRLGNAMIVGVLTAIADAVSHENHADPYSIAYSEHIVTGAVSFGLALAGSYLFEHSARHIRSAWSRLSRRGN